MSNFDWKSISDEDLRWIYKNTSFPFKPHKHQLICMAFANDKNRIGFWADVGTGKTLTSLWTARQWGCQKLLVICPSSAISSWVRDAKVMNRTYRIISGSTKERKWQINQDQDITIIPYTALKTVYAEFSSAGYNPLIKNILAEDTDNIAKAYPDCKLLPDELHPKYFILWKPKGKTWNINPDLFNQDFDCVIYDEIHRCMDHTSLQSNICLELSRRTDFTIGLSGTPVDKSLLDLFNIYQVLDLGQTFGTNFFKYRNVNFMKNGYDWDIRPSRKQHILDQWARSSLSFDRSECSDLPAFQDLTIVLQPTKEFLRLEEKVVLQQPLSVAGLDNIYAHPSVAVTKLKQLTDGFIYPGKDKKPYRLKENPKLEATLEIVECGKKIIIFHDYVEVGEILEETFCKKKITYVRFRGGQTSDERIGLEHQFQNTDVQIAVVQKTGSEGWDGYAAQITLFWDVIPSPRLRKQCVGRMLRDGQEHETVILELMIKDSINMTTKQNQDGRMTEVQEYMQYVQKYGTGQHS